MNSLNEFLSKQRDSRWREKAEFRKANKDWLKKSARIAIKLSRVLRELEMSQKELAIKMGVSPQQISKIMKGGENLTLETITKLEKVLKVELISIPDKTEMMFSVLAAKILKKHLLKTTEVIESRVTFNIVIKETMKSTKPWSKMEKFSIASSSKLRIEESNYALAA